MRWQTRVVNWFFRLIFRTVCRIDSEELKKIPAHGPLIIVGNHVNFLEGPVLLPHMDSPEVIGIAKKESWDNPLFKALFDLWGIIPIDRDAVDRDAFRDMVGVLKGGKILVVFPEGTRSGGQMLQGKPGIVAIIARSGAPILPVGLHGYENFWTNLKQLRRTDFHIKIGQPFHLDLNNDPLSRELRQAATDEIMYKIAELLPERYRGYYAFSQAVQYRFAVAGYPSA